MEDEAARLIAALRRAVDDERVLEAIAAVPRELFVPDRLRGRAYANTALPIACGQTISQPLVVARMCEVLELSRTDRVLEVGTGSGYHAAVLAKLCAHVWSVEQHAELSAAAAQSLRAAGVANVTLIVGDGSCGYEPGAPYDGISVAAAAPPDVLPALEAQLAPGGRLVAPVAAATGERLVLVRRVDGTTQRSLEPVRFVPLAVGAGDEDAYGHA
jgi:protein-L-isoaspartate(D-aspartate) O-methyltransferase